MPIFELQYSIVSRHCCIALHCIARLVDTYTRYLIQHVTPTSVKQIQHCLEQLHVPLSAVNAGECQMTPSALPVSLTVCQICPSRMRPPTVLGTSGKLLSALSVNTKAVWQHLSRMQCDHMTMHVSSACSLAATTKGAVLMVSDCS